MIHNGKNWNHIFFWEQLFRITADWQSCQLSCSWVQWLPSLARQRISGRTGWLVKDMLFLVPMPAILVFSFSLHMCTPIYPNFIFPTHRKLGYFLELFPLRNNVLHQSRAKIVFLNKLFVLKLGQLQAKKYNTSISHILHFIIYITV